MSIYGCHPTTTADGQTFLVQCATTGAEGIWSPGEAGTFQAWCDEHQAAHERHDDDQYRRETWRIMRQSAVHTYRTTEPGDPRRRGIGAFL